MLLFSLAQRVIHHEHAPGALLGILSFLDDAVTFASSSTCSLTNHWSMAAVGGGPLRNSQVHQLVRFGR